MTILRRGEVEERFFISWASLTFLVKKNFRVSILKDYEWSVLNLW